jgi:hypothetical protein
MRTTPELPQAVLRLAQVMTVAACGAAVAVALTSLAVDFTQMHLAVDQDDSWL